MLLKLMNYPSALRIIIQGQFRKQRSFVLGNPVFEKIIIPEQVDILIGHEGDENMQKLKVLRRLA